MNRIPTGRLDHELSVERRTTGPVPELEIRPVRYCLAAGAWVDDNGPARIQVQYLGRLSEVLLSEGKAAAEFALFAPPAGGERG